MKRFLSIMLAMMMVASLFAVNASAATGEYVKTPASFYTEDFDRETHSFNAYAKGATWSGKLVDGDTGEGNAFYLTPGTGNSVEGAVVNVPANYTLEFDFYHIIEDATSGSCFRITVTDGDSTATVKNFGVNIGVLPLTAYKWYSMKMVVDESKLTAAGNLPAVAVTLYWKEKGAADWNLAQWDEDNTYDSTTTVMYRPNDSFGNVASLIGANAIAFGKDVVVDNINAYVYEDVLVAAHDYAAKEDFSGITYALTNVSVSDGVATTSATAVVSADLPEKFVIEFDLQASGGQYDVYIRDTARATRPNLTLRIAGNLYDPTMTYTYKFIIDESLLTSGDMDIDAIKWYRKEVGTDTWVQGGYSSGYNAYAIGNPYYDITGARVAYEGGYVPVVRPLDNNGSQNIADKSVGFAANGTIDNIKISGLGAVRVSEIANDTAIGAKVEFNDADATDLSTARTLFVAAYNGDVLADVDFESVNAANGLYTAELAVDKATYDEVKIFVWETANNAPALPTVFDLNAWLD